MKLIFSAGKIGFIFLFLLFCSALNAQDNSQLKLLQDKFNSLKNLSADFVESGGGKTILSGKFYYEKENKFRLELKNLTIVTDGKTTWNYNKKEKKLIISTYDANDQSLLSIKNIIDVYPSKCKITSTEENSLNVLTLTPKESGLSFKSAKLWISSGDAIQDNLISKMNIDYTNGQTVTFEFSGYKIDQDLPGSLFTITPPKGSKVIDLR